MSPWVHSAPTHLKESITMKHNQIKSKADRVILERKHKRERKPKVRNYSPNYYDDVLEDQELKYFLTFTDILKHQFTEE
jgi:hypothetical protein